MITLSKPCTQILTRAINNIVKLYAWQVFSIKVFTSYRCWIFLGFSKPSPEWDVFTTTAIHIKITRNNKMNCELMLTYDTPALRQTGSGNLTGQKTLPTIWGTYIKLVTKYQISAINICWEKCDEIWTYLFNVFKNQQSRQTGSRNLMGPKTLPTIWGTYMKLVTKYQIRVINSCWEICDEKCAYMFNVYKSQLSRQTGSRNLTGQNGVPIWSLWRNIRFLPSIFAEKNATKYEHICSMCIKINKVGKQEVGIWWVQKRFPRYGVPIWS